MDRIDYAVVSRKTTTPAYRIIKSCFDRISALLGLIVLLLPMAVIAGIIAMERNGSPIYKQERLGKDGKVFLIYKFRTMKADAETDKPMRAEPNDDRCTKVGAFLRKYHLDELPQLYNILEGDMSFVGPRPERPYFHAEFEKKITGFSDRLAVKPGLTGYAQICGGYDLPPEEKIVYDRVYIRNQSIRMDVKCMAKTIPVVLTKKYSE